MTPIYRLLVNFPASDAPPLRFGSAAGRMRDGQPFEEDRGVSGRRPGSRGAGARDPAAMPPSRVLEMNGIMKPTKKEVGGDFYDFFRS